ncbi:MAG TPA: hypothetical protein P5250_04285 [Bacteroidales bacterium]|nr:hypothetical protein [Bacteroidales bacterium]
MHVYKFRVLSDIEEDFYRDIEIKATQTFQDLHDILIENLNFNKNELASFYLSNNNWEKLKEITLIDMGETTETKTPIMKNAILRDYIDDPHQRIIWVYDFLKMETFYIELIKITQAKNGLNYPIVVASKGEITKAMQQNPNKNSFFMIDNELLMTNINNNIDDDNIDYIEDDYVDDNDKDFYDNTDDLFSTNENLF